MSGEFYTVERSLEKKFLKFEKENDIAEVIKKYSEREDQFEDLPQFWINYGKMIMTTVDLNKAIKTIEKALEIDPESTDALMNIGAVYSYMNRMDKLKSYLEKVLKIDPKHEEAWYTLSEFWRNKGRIEKQK